MAGVDDAEAEEVLAEFDFLVSEQSGEGAGEAQSHGDGPDWGMCYRITSPYPLSVLLHMIQLV